jgi:hypothetical protein
MPPKKQSDQFEKLELDNDKIVELMKINFKKHVFNTKEFVKYDSILFYLADFMRRKCIDVSPPGSFELTIACFVIMNFTRISVKPNKFEEMIKNVIEKMKMVVDWEDFYDEYFEEFLRTEFFDVNAAKFASILYIENCSSQQNEKNVATLNKCFNGWGYEMLLSIELRVWLQNINSLIKKQLKLKQPEQFVDEFIFVTLCIFNKLRIISEDQFVDDNLNRIIFILDEKLVSVENETRNNVGDAAIHNIAKKLINAPSWNGNLLKRLKMLMHSAPVGNNNNSGSRKKPRLENSTHDRVKVDDLPQFIRTEFVKADNDIKNHIDSIQDKFLDEVKKLFVNIVDFHTKK